MKPILVFAFVFLCVHVFGQQIPSQIQAKRGVFTEQLFLKDRWIDRISTNLNSTDSTSHNLLATGDAIRLSKDYFIQTHASAPQPANFQILGTATVSSKNRYWYTYADSYAAQLTVAQGASQYGLCIQRASNDLGPADIVNYKNFNTRFNIIIPPGLGERMGVIDFNGVTGNLTTTAPMTIDGTIEKNAPAYKSGGFIFYTTDSTGYKDRRMGINAKGNLMIGYAIDNNYKLNVFNGDVRFNSLSGEGDLLAGSNNDGVITKIFPGENIYVENGQLNASNRLPYLDGYNRYIAVLTQSGQGDPVVQVIANHLGEDITWTRTSTGNYVGSLQTGTFDPLLMWLSSHPSDPSGNIVNTRLYQSGANTLNLNVKGNAMVDRDDWSQITVEIRRYIGYQ